MAPRGSAGHTKTRGAELPKREGSARTSRDAVGPISSGLSAVLSTACDAHAAAPGTAWPAALRVSQMKSTKRIWEMTGRAGPDGRATFEFATVDRELVRQWRRVGDHGIYRNP